MNRDDIIRMAREAGMKLAWIATLPGSDKMKVLLDTDQVERFAALVAAAEREKVAAWMMQRSYATGHGDTIEDLIKELEWQVAEREREECAQLCETKHFSSPIREAGAKICAVAIRARGNK